METDIMVLFRILNQMVKVNTVINQARFIQVLLRKGLKMVWGKYIFQMEILMKVCGKMDLNMVEANIVGVMEIIIKVGFG